MSLPIPPEDIERFIALRKEGRTIMEIAKATGWAEGSVSVRLRKAGMNHAPKYDYAAAHAQQMAAQAQDNELAHIEPLIALGGFCALKPDIAERFYALEAKPVAGRQFWRGV